MEDLILQPAALDLLEVAATATGPADPGYYIFREWCAMSEDKRSAALLNTQDLTGIMYLNTNLYFQAISIIGSPANRPHRKKWCIGQLGTRLSRGPKAIRFNCAAVCGDIVVIMREPYTKELGLLYDASKIITADNCQFWADFNPEKDLPGEGKLRMATLPRAILFGQGAVVP